VKAAESKILEACPAQAKDYYEDKAVEVARAKAAADFEAGKAAEAAKANADAEAAALQRQPPKLQLRPQRICRFRG
jgi:anti-sigma factor RsiW